MEEQITILGVSRLTEDIFWQSLLVQDKHYSTIHGKSMDICHAVLRNTLTMRDKMDHRIPI